MKFNQWAQPGLARMSPGTCHAQMYQVTTGFFVLVSHFELVVTTVKVDLFGINGFLHDVLRVPVPDGVTRGRAWPATGFQVP